MQRSEVRRVYGCGRRIEDGRGGRSTLIGAACGLTTLLGCTAGQPAPPYPFPAPEPFAVAADTLSPVPTTFAYPLARAYTAHAQLLVRVDSVNSAAIEPAFYPLDVLTLDELRVLVACDICTPVTAGWVEQAEVIHSAPAPGVAALGTLGEFALAVSTAAAAHDLEALRPAMAPDFFFSFVGVQSPDAAFEVWRSEDFASLDQVPALLGQGLLTIDGSIWAAPREYVETYSYGGLRLGFRQRGDGRWEWLFLVRGVAG